MSGNKSILYNYVCCTIVALLIAAPQASATTSLTESWDPATAATLTNGATVSGNNSWLYTVGGSAGSVRITAGADKSAEHFVSGSIGAPLLLTAPLATSFDGATVTTTVQFRATFNQTGTEAQRDTRLEIYAGTGTQDGYAVQINGRTTQAPLSVALINAGVTGAFTTVGGGAGSQAINKEYQIVVSFAKNGANTSVSYSVANLTDGGFLVAAATTTLSAQAIDPGTTLSNAQLRFTRRSRCAVDDLVVSFVDSTAPVITRTGAASVQVDAGSTYVDGGATATDNVDGDITANIVVTNPVDTAIPGTYTVRYNVSDAAGNPATEVTRTVEVVDATPPVITRIGASSVQVNFGASYVDAGATALDNIDGDITANIIVTNPVNTAVPGTYTVRYNVMDAAGNPALEVTRSVEVVDVTAPVITRTGPASVQVNANATYVDSGATALDDVDGNITANIVVTNPVNTAIPGTYTVRYNVSDAAGNPAIEVTRSVEVVDVTAPVITRTGPASVQVNASAAYVDAGATALDDVDGNITANIVVTNPVNTAIPGTYTLRYNVSDAAGNPAIEVTRSVEVVDATPPVITRTGPASVQVSCASTYVDAGATATDNVDGNITPNIVVTNPVNTSVPGIYTVRYNVMDAASNPAIERTRTVEVLNCPEFTIGGPSTAFVGEHVVLSAITPPTLIAPVSFVWFKDGDPIDDETGNSLEFLSITADDAGVYWFIVTDGSKGTFPTSEPFLIEIIAAPAVDPEETPVTSPLGMSVLAVTLLLIAVRRQRRRP